MPPQSHICTLILDSRGGFLSCPDGKSFPGLGKQHGPPHRERETHDSWGIDLLCALDRMSGYLEPSCLCSHLGLLTYKLCDFGQSY